MSQLLAPDKLQEKINSIITRHARVMHRKAELAGELKSKREELADLVREISASGYNPKTLVEERNKTQAELEQMAQDYESQLSEVEATFDEYDKK